MNAPDPVIFIDDETHVRTAGRQTLELAGYDVTCLESAAAALDHIALDWPGIVVCDIKMPGMDGLTFLQRARDIDTDLPVVLITGHGDIAMAVKAIRDGAYDFIEKPYAADLLVDAVSRAKEKRRLTLENRELRRELEIQDGSGPRIIGRTPAMRQLRRLIATIAETETDILIQGETGTGKELVASCLHELSRRRDNNFVAVNCGAIPENLIESELFGHEPGAFTGAQKRRIGKFEHADGGTMFLDEIESMPLNLQVRLLRVLQERAIERLGSNTVIPLNLRVVAAAKVDLKQASDDDTFRQDLYYRLNVVTLEIPPLRERLEDIPLLFHHFVMDAALRHDREVPMLTGDQMRGLMAHDWPGNVRELQNIAERFVLFFNGQAGDLQSVIDGFGGGTDMNLAQQVETFEKSLIAQELARHKGDMKKTLAALGTPRKTLYDKMRKYSLSRDDFR